MTAFMGRLGWVYVLIGAVLAAAIGLTFYSYDYSRQLARGDRLVILRTMAELAEEKVIGIETEILRIEGEVLEVIDIENLKAFLEYREVREKKLNPVPVYGVLVLDADFKIVPGGNFSQRVGDELDEFLRFFDDVVLPALDLENAPLNERQHLYIVHDGLEYLFSAVRRYSGGQIYHVVIEADLNHIATNIFPPFFQVRHQHEYQVVDQGGEIVWGTRFPGIPDDDVIELPFSQTLSGWRLRVANRDRQALEPKRRPLVDFILIGTALGVIVFALVLILRSVRQERRANELKSDFISNVSHELKTPLSIISMFGELLAMGRTKSAAQATEYAEIIRRESVRLSRLIDNVLDFAKIEKGMGDIELVEGDLVDVVERATELCSHRADRAELDLSLEVEPDIPMLRIDPNALTLATLNLLDNAIKYAAEGEKIEVSVRRSERGVELAVRDFGPGIAEDEQVAIFDRFYRARRVRLLPIRGSGIGLALVKHVAEAHGGGLEVESAENQGATFRLWIPAPSGG